MISNLIKIELAYINTSHPDFIGGRFFFLVAVTNYCAVSTCLVSRAVAQLMDRVSNGGSVGKAAPRPEPQAVGISLSF